MMKIWKRSIIATFLCEGTSFLLIVLGTRVDDDLISGTWYCRLGLLFHWPGMKMEDAIGGAIINNWVTIVGVPLILWLLVWVAIWFSVEKIQRRGTPN
jgi:hypothetical protein